MGGYFILKRVSHSNKDYVRPQALAHYIDHYASKDAVSTADTVRVSAHYLDDTPHTNERKTRFYCLF